MENLFKEGENSSLTVTSVEGSPVSTELGKDSGALQVAGQPFISLCLRRAHQEWASERSWRWSGVVVEELQAEDSSNTGAGDKCDEDRATERDCCVVTQPSAPQVGGRSSSGSGRKRWAMS